MVSALLSPCFCHGPQWLFPDQQPVCSCLKASQIPSLLHSKASNGISCHSEWKSQFSWGPPRPQSLHPLPSPLPSRCTGLPVCPAHSECSCSAVLDLHFPDCSAQAPMWHFPEWHLLRAPFPILIHGFPPYLGCPCAFPCLIFSPSCSSASNTLLYCYR